MRLQSSNSASEEQKYAIEKYLYKKYWKVDNINGEFMEKWFRKTYVLNNVKQLLRIDDVNEMTKLLTVDKYNQDSYLI